MGASLIWDRRPGEAFSPSRGAYGASKHALRALTIALRMELHRCDTNLGALHSRERGARACTFPSAGRERYGPVLAIVNRAASELASGGTPVAMVVDVVVRAVTARKPQTVYSVGRNSRLRVMLELLPDSLRDRIIMRGVLRGS